MTDPPTIQKDVGTLPCTTWGFHAHTASFDRVFLGPRLLIYGANFSDRWRGVALLNVNVYGAAMITMVDRRTVKL